MSDLDIPHRIIPDHQASQQNWEYLLKNFESRVITLSSGIAILKNFVDAKGDLITATANDTPSRKAVGADNTKLIADSSQGDGLKWANKESLLVTSLPTSPSTGDTCVYTDSLTAPTYFWYLMYNASQSAANKWQVIGATQLRLEITTSQTTATTGSYVDLATTGPSFTAPLAGDYLVTVSYTWSQLAAVASFMSISVAGGAASDNDASQVNLGASSGTSGPRTSLKTGLAATNTIVAKYKTNTASAPNLANRTMIIQPVRVG